MRRRRAVRPRPARRRDAGHQRARGPHAAPRATAPSTELPVIMVTARTRGRRHRRSVSASAPTTTSPSRSISRSRSRGSPRTCRTSGRSSDLRESEERYALAVHGANDGLWDWNLATNEVYWSPRWKAMLGYDESEIGTSPDEWLTRVHHDDVARVKDALTAHLADGSGHYESEHRMLHRNGTFRWVLCRGAAVRNGAGTRDAAGRLAHRHHRREGGRRVDRAAEPAAVRRPARARAQARRSGARDYVFALLVLGLDRFKDVSDSLGPLIADRLLVAVARRLQSSLRATDVVTRDEPAFTLARLGGDEFTVLLDDITDASDAVRVAERLRARAARSRSTSTAIRCSRRRTSASRSARPATSGRKRSCAMPPPRSTARRPTARRRASSSIRRCASARSRGCRSRPTCGNAVDDGAFEVHYQPIVSLRPAASSRSRRWCAGAIRARDRQPGRLHRARRRDRA